MITYFEILPKELITLISVNLSSDDIESFYKVSKNIIWEYLLQSLNKDLIPSILSKIGISKYNFNMLYIDLLKLQEEWGYKDDIFDIINHYLSSQDTECFILDLDSSNFICGLYIGVKYPHLYKVMLDHQLMLDHIYDFSIEIAKYVKIKCVEGLNEQTIDIHHFIIFGDLIPNFYERMDDFIEFIDSDYGIPYMLFCIVIMNEDTSKLEYGGIIYKIITLMKKSFPYYTRGLIDDYIVKLIIENKDLYLTCEYRISLLSRFQ